MRLDRWISILSFAVIGSGCGRVPQLRQTPLPQEAFVWQRVWTPEVCQAVQEATASSLHILAAEVRFDPHSADITTIEPDWKALMSHAGPKGAVIRIHASAAKTRWNPDAVNSVKSLLDTTLQRFDAAGIRLKEIQLDYDCPESRLGDYTKLLRELHADWAELLKVTALPSWLGSPEAPELLELSPGYVLQVHSLHLPHDGGKFTLMNETEARAVVARAVDLEVPFRVALPTYSCVVLFDDKGTVTEVHGEDLPAGLSLGKKKYVVLDADAFGLATLVEDWRKHAPELLQSVIWYRLPVATDRLNWPVHTFEKILRGSVLKRGWAALLETRAEGLCEVVLLQQGDAPDDLPRDIEITDVKAADGLRGYIIRGQPHGTVHLRLEAPERYGRIRPGERIVAGWVRIGEEAKVKILHQDAGK